MSGSSGIRKRKSIGDEEENIITKKHKTATKEFTVSPKDEAILYDPNEPSANKWPTRETPITFDQAKAGTDIPIRVYADGIYDMFHSGHAKSLQQAKKLFPNTYLIVGTCSDKITHKLKGFTVMSDVERYEMLRHCRYVDEIITEAPWVLTREFMDKHKIDFVAHDDVPYNSAGHEDIYKFVKDAGQFAATQRTPCISTSDIITRIVRDYDLYVQRNLSRGYSRKDLNVGFIKEKELAVKEKYNRIKGKSQEIITNWEDKSREFIGGFIDLFGKDSMMNDLWERGKHRLSLTGKTIKEAFSPPGSPVHGACSSENYGEVSSDEDDVDGEKNTDSENRERKKINREELHYFEV